MTTKYRDEGFFIVRDRTSEIVLTFCPTLALQRIKNWKTLTFHISSICSERWSNEKVRRLINLCCWGKNANDVISEIKCRRKFEIKSSQSVGLKSCDVNLWRKVRLSLLDYKRTSTELWSGKEANTKNKAIHWASQSSLWQPVQEEQWKFQCTAKIIVSVTNV